MFGIVYSFSILLMLLLPLPFILSRERNIKVSVGLCVLITAVFYASVYLVRYVHLDSLAIWLGYSGAGAQDIATGLAAWLPAVVFAPIAVLGLDSLKT